MPCYEPGYAYSRADCILCSIFHTAAENDTLKEMIRNLDYNLIGLSKEQAEEWWESHKELDRKKLKEKR